MGFLLHQARRSYLCLLLNADVGIADHDSVVFCFGIYDGQQDYLMSTYLRLCWVSVLQPRLHECLLLYAVV